MASGIITGGFSGGTHGNTESAKFQYKLIWSSESDAANLRSKVILSWYVVVNANGYYTNKANAGWSWSTDIGLSNSGSTSFNPSAATLVNGANNLYRTDTIYVPHDPDGTKSFTITGAIDLSGTRAGYGSLSGTITLDTIAVNPPTVGSLTISDIGTGYSSVGAYVAGFTKLRFTATATQGDGALASYAFYRDSTLLGTVTTDATTATFDMTTFESAGSFVYSVTVTDAYGLSGSKALSATTIAAYTMPTITATTYRSNSSGTADNEGTYGYCNMTYTVASVGSNAAVVHSVTINGNSYTTFPAIASGLATTASYDAVYLVTDKLGKSATITQTVQVSFINFDMYPSSNGGAAFGEAAQEDKFIVNQSESIFRGSVEIQGAPLPIASGGTGGNTAATARAALGTDAVELTNGGITSEYKLLVVWLQGQEGIANHYFCVTIPNVSGQTFVQPYSTFNSATMAVLSVLLYVNNGSVTISGCYGGFGNFSRTTFSNPTIQKIYGIK